VAPGGRKEFNSRVAHFWASKTTGRQNKYGSNKTIKIYPAIGIARKATVPLNSSSGRNRLDNTNDPLVVTRMPKDESSVRRAQWTFDFSIIQKTTDAKVEHHELL
jgi:hypothetical protein